MRPFSFMAGVQALIDRQGITSFVSDDNDELAPVVERLAGT